MAPAAIMALAGGTKALGGVLQAAFSGQKKAEKALGKEIDAIQFPSLLNIYAETKRRYGISPEQSAFYKGQMQNIARSQATGLRTLQQSGNVLGGLPSILDVANRSSLAAKSRAEEEKNRRFGQYMSAAQMKTQAELAKQNQKISAAAAKAAGAAAIKRSGLTNIYGGLTDIGKAYMSKEDKD